MTTESRSSFSQHIEELRALGLPLEQIRSMVTLKTADLKAAFPEWWGGNSDSVYGFVPLEISLTEFMEQAVLKGLKVERDKDRDDSLINMLSLYPPLKNRTFVTAFRQNNHSYKILVGENPLDDSDSSTYISDQDFNLLKFALASFAPYGS